MNRKGCILIFGELKIDVKLLDEIAMQLCSKMEELIKPKSAKPNFGILIDFETTNPVNSVNGEIIIDARFITPSSLVSPLKILGIPTGLLEEEGPKYYWNTEFPIDLINQHLNSITHIKGVTIEGAINLPDLFLSIIFKDEITQDQLSQLQLETEKFATDSLIYASKPDLLNPKTCVVHFDSYGTIPDFKRFIKRLIKLEKLPKIELIQLS